MTGVGGQPGTISVSDTVPPSDDRYVAFGDVIIGRSKTESITLSNSSSTADLVVSSIALGSSGHYQISGLPAFPATIQPGGSFSFNVTYTAAANGLEYNYVAISCNDPNDPYPYVWMNANGSDPIVITPAEDLVSMGIVGGPFAPDAKVYTLTNSTTSTLNWSAARTPWVSVSPSTGTLTAGATQDVTISIDASANTFGIGQYSSSVIFTNMHLGSSQYRNVNLTVNPPPPSKTIDPAPADGAVDQSINTVVSWQNGGGSDRL